MENHGVKKNRVDFGNQRVVVVFLEQQRRHAAHFALLLYKDFKVLVDDGHGQEDSRTRTNGAQEVSHYGEPSYTQATEGSGCGDVPAKQGRREHVAYDPEGGSQHTVLGQRKCDSSRVRCHLFSSCTIDVSLWPLMTICCSFSCFAT